MIELRGRYNNAFVYNDFVEESAQGQIIELLNIEVFKDVPIRIMADVHAGEGCVIGFTAPVSDKVIPNIVGVDQFCGMSIYKLDSKFNRNNINREELDIFIRSIIPLDKNVNPKEQYTQYCSKEEINIIHDKVHQYCSYFKMEPPRVFLSLGSLGGGNHFIELNVDSEERLYLVIHSGSRNFGYRTAQLFQKKAIEHCSSNQIKISKPLSYLEGEDKDSYLDCMKFCGLYADVNRRVIARKIIDRCFEGNGQFSFQTIHNYIDENNMIRKGSISAQLNELLLIPINMGQGSIIGRGKGNSDMNYSAPHGAGRPMSRGDAKRTLNMEDFRKSMEGIYSTCIDEAHLDESPGAYKPIENILENISDTVDIIEIIKPIYNLKG